MKKIRVGILGLGVGLKHLEAYNKSKYSIVKAVCDFDKNKLKKIKKKYPKIKTTQLDNKIIKNPDIDLVSIATYDEYHFEQVKKCIKFNKQIFVEKPLCLTNSQLRIIKGMVKKKKINIESNFVLRTTDLFNKLMRILKREINKLYYIEADYLWSRYKKLFGWRNKTKNFSLILGGAIHMIDLICWLINKYPIEVKTYANNIALKNTNFKKNSFFLIILKFKNNLLVKLSFNSNSNTNHFHQLKIFTANKSIFHTP